MRGRPARARFRSKGPRRRGNRQEKEGKKGRAGRLGLPRDRDSPLWLARYSRRPTSTKLRLYTKSPGADFGWYWTALGARHKSPDPAAAGSIEPESHLAAANGINNLQMTFWRVEISGVLRGQSSVGAQEISPRREPWEACDIGQAPERGGRARRRYVPPLLGTSSRTFLSHGSPHAMGYLLPHSGCGILLA